jgi:hypothetical protein
MRVFVAHSRENKEVAVGLAGALRGKGIDTWLDVTDFQGGASWRDELDRAAAAADAFVFVVGPGSGTDPVQQAQWKSALRSEAETDKLMVPVLIGEDTKAPPFLTGRQVIRMDLSEPEFSEIARQVVYSLEHPEETKDREAYESAKREQILRLGEVKRYAESCKAAERQEVGIADNDLLTKNGDSQSGAR